MNLKFMLIPLLFVVVVNSAPNPFGTGKLFNVPNSETIEPDNHPVQIPSGNRVKRSRQECIGITTGAAAGTGALTGAAAGAAIGSVVPGLGTLLGAGLGAAAGALGAGGLGAAASSAGCR